MTGKFGYERVNLADLDTSSDEDDYGKIFNRDQRRRLIKQNDQVCSCVKPSCMRGLCVLFTIFSSLLLIGTAAFYFQEVPSEPVDTLENNVIEKVYSNLSNSDAGEVNLERLSTQEYSSVPITTEIVLETTTDALKTGSKDNVSDSKSDNLEETSSTTTTTSEMTSSGFITEKDEKQYTPKELKGKEGKANVDAGSDDRLESHSDVKEEKLQPSSTEASLETKAKKAKGKSLGNKNNEDKTSSTKDQEEVTSTTTNEKETTTTLEVYEETATTSTLQDVSSSDASLSTDEKQDNSSSGTDDVDEPSITKELEDDQLSEKVENTEATEFNESEKNEYLKNP